jgi:hypothetical protein
MDHCDEAKWSWAYDCKLVPALIASENKWHANTVLLSKD